jgi:hypothetical protein
MRIALDFDGVIAENIGFPEIGKVKEGVKDAITDFKKKGFSIYVHTARHDTEEVSKWMKEQGFPEMMVTNMKLPADVYVDDRAYRIIDWSRKDTKNIINQALDHGQYARETKLQEYLK